MRTERQRSVGRNNDLRDSARGGTRTLKARRPPDFESFPRDPSHSGLTDKNRITTALSPHHPQAVLPAFTP